MTILAIVGEAALRSMALACAAATCLWVLRVRHAGVEKRVWAAVLLLSAAMPAAVAWRVPRFTLALFAPGAPVYKAPLSIAGTPALPAAAPSGGWSAPVARPEQHMRGRTVASALTFQRILLFLYLSAAAGIVGRVGFGLRAAMRLWQEAEPFTRQGVQQTGVRISKAVGSPATLGSGILLPPDAHGWTLETLRAVLAHERTHADENDFILQLAAQLHLAAFPFSPLAWWLPGKLARLSEALCDRAAVEAVGDNLLYAQLLLGFAAWPAPLRPFAAMARSAGVQKRIERLLADPGLQRSFRQRRGQAPAAALLLAAASLATAATLRIVHPERLVLAASLPGAREQSTAPNPAHSQAQLPQPAAPASPALRKAAPSASGAAHGTDVCTLTGPEIGEVEVARGGTQIGTGSQGGTLRFRKDGKTWVVRDPGFVAEALAACAPMQELGRQQAELGSRQGALGRQQGELGTRQAALGAEQQALAEQVGKVEFPSLPTADIELPRTWGTDISKLVNDEVRLALHGDTLSADERTRLEAERDQLQTSMAELEKQIAAGHPQMEALARQARELQERMAPLGRRMAELAREQAGLAAQQSSLGFEQGGLGARQGAAGAEAERKLQALLNRALRDGKAQLEK